MDKNKKIAISTVVPIVLIAVIVMLVLLVRRRTAKRKPSLMTKDNIEYVSNMAVFIIGLVVNMWKNAQEFAHCIYFPHKFFDLMTSYFAGVG